METFLFVFSKVFWFCFRLDNFLFFGMVLGWYLKSTKRFSPLGRRLIFTSTIVFIAFSFFPISSLVIRPLETRFSIRPWEQLPTKVDGVIVLGGGINPEVSSKRKLVELNAAGDRAIYFYALSKKYPNAKLVYTSGSGNLRTQEYKEATVSQKFFKQLGMDTNKVEFESNSRNTYENARESKKLVSPKTSETWILVTSAFHMPRSVGVFRKIGWPVIPFPVDYRTSPDETLLDLKLGILDASDTLQAGIKEWLGLTAYYILGRTDSWFPSEQKTALPD